MFVCQVVTVGPFCVTNATARWILGARILSTPPLRRKPFRHCEPATAAASKSCNILIHVHAHSDYHSAYTYISAIYRPSSCPALISISWFIPLIRFLDLIRSFHSFVRFLHSIRSGLARAFPIKLNVIF